MRIDIIGAGSVGATLGRAWIKHGEDVIWGLRNPADSKHAALPKERVKRPADAVKEAGVVVIATPWSAAEAAIKSLGSLAGKTVIDCMNPLGMGLDGLQLVLGFDTSAGEQVVGNGEARRSTYERSIATFGQMGRPPISSTLRFSAIPTRPTATLSAILPM
jgi:8-hydroxy-5-deazaflavin:NADPH oxidoreductase